MEATGAPIVLFLPALDEAGAIGRVLARVPCEIGPHPVVRIVVDDGSTDDTARIAERGGAVVVAHLATRGLGAAVRTGLASALTLDPVAVAFCDADGEYAPEELHRLVEPILAGEADYVVGSRFAGSRCRMRPHRRIGNRLLTTALRRVTSVDISDGQSGFRALSQAAARSAVIQHDYNYAQVLTIDLLQRGFRYAEVPISYSFRRTGRSFVRLFPYLAHVVPAVARQARQTRRSDGTQFASTQRRAPQSSTM